MPRRELLTPTQQANLPAFPTSEQDIALHYTFCETDMAIIRQRRGAHNRLGFAIQLCCLRFPGQALAAARRAEKRSVFRQMQTHVMMPAYYRHHLPADGLFFHRQSA